MKPNNIIKRALGWTSIGIGRSNKQYVKGELDHEVTYFVKKYGYVRVYPERKEISVRIQGGGLKFKEFKEEFSNPYNITKLDGVGDSLWITIKHEVQLY